MAQNDDILKDFKQLKKDLRRIVKKWTLPMGLGWWTLDIYYDYSGDLGDDGGGGNTMASLRARWEYKTATITFNMSALLEIPVDDLEKIVVHEMVHIPLTYVAPSNVTDEYRKLMELTVTSLTDAFLWVRDAAVKGKLPPEN